MGLIKGEIILGKEKLHDFYANHSGKVSAKLYSYLRLYEEVLKPYRDEPINILEFGVQNGGSLEIWSKYFGNAKNIVGCDINPDCSQLKFVDSRIHIINENVNSSRGYDEVLKNCSSIDILIDDASHLSGDIIKSFMSYFPHISDGGIYIVEDLCCSYWREYDGGLFNKLSSISFFKQIVDIVNYQYWGHSIAEAHFFKKFQKEYGIDVSEDFFKDVYSVEFYNSLCVIRKQQKLSNETGKFVIGGKEEPIQKWSHLHLTQISVPQQLTADKENIIDCQRQEIEKLQERVNVYENSRGYRLIKFLKELRKKLIGNVRMKNA